VSVDPTLTAALVPAVAGLIGTSAGLWVGRRQRRASLADLETQIAERLLKHLDERLRAALADVDRLRTEVAGLRRRLEERDALVEELRGERDQARAAVADVRAQLTAKEAELAAALREVDDLKALVAHGQSAAAGQ
jgi:chromosome segregation ATPase